MKAEKTFKKIAKGGILFSLGTISATIMQFVTGILLIRMLSLPEYGLLTLGVTTITILSSFAIIGFQVGLPRFISKYNVLHDMRQAGNIASSALTTAFSLSILCASILYVMSEELATYFDKPQLNQVFQIMLFMIPAGVLIDVLTAIFRGVENVKAKIWFQDVLGNLLKLILLMITFIVGLNLRGVLWVYVVSTWLTLILYFAYARYNLKNWKLIGFEAAVARDLFVFSLPLFGVVVIDNIVNWTSVLLLGYLHSAEEVSFLNAPLRLVNLIPIPLASLVFLYLPLASKLIDQDSGKDLQHLYISTTKWSFLITLPLLIYFLIDAEFIVEFLFGPAYREACDILRILTLGYSVHTFFGPNGMTLASYGETRLLFVASFIASVGAVALCIILIPLYGATGAAYGASIAKVLHNIGLSYFLFIRFQIHPFAQEYIRPVFFVLLVAVPVAIIWRDVSARDLLLHSILFSVIVLLTLVSPFITRSISPTDLEIIHGIERRFTAKAGSVRRWLA